MLETTRLTNGVIVVSRAMPGLRGATLGLWLLNGVRHEPAGCNGWAALLERLLFAGAGQMDAHNLALRLDNLGARVQASTGRELTVLEGQVPGVALLDLLETLTDMLLTPRFDDQALARERINLARRRGSISPALGLRDAAAALAWGDHPLGRPLLGVPADLEGLRATELQAYRHSLMQGSRLVVVAAGAVDHDRLLTACGALESLPTGRPPRAPAPRFQPGHHRRAQGGEQVRLHWAWPVPGAADPGGPALELACQCLGGGPSSRLHRQLVIERGLAQEVTTGLERHGDWGLWWLEVDCPASRTGACQRLVAETLEELAEQGPGGEELAAARHRRRSTLLLGSDDPRATVARLAREMIYRERVERIELPLFELEQVELEQVRVQMARLGEGLLVEWSL